MSTRSKRVDFVHGMRLALVAFSRYGIFEKVIVEFTPFAPPTSYARGFRWASMRIALAAEMRRAR